MSSSSRDRRHCMVVHAYYPVGETRVQREAAALVDQGWEVDVICLKGPGEASSERVDGVAVHRLPVRRHRGSSTFMQLAEYLAFFSLALVRLSTLHMARRFDTVQVHNLPDFLVFAALVPKLMGATILLDLHDLMPELYAARTGKGVTGLLPRILRFQEKLACWFADHVITVTEGWRQRLVDRSTRPEKVSVVMNLADPNVFPVRTVDSRDDELTIVYHGTFTARYGVDLLVRAFHQLCDEIPESRLLLLGDGESREELEHLIRTLGIADRVEMSDGMVDTEHLPDLLERADIGVVPNRSTVFTEEILPTKLLEYVAMGIPVVAARTAVITSYFNDDMVEFFRPGDVGDLANRIRDLNKDRDRLASLARNAAKFNEIYGWERASSDYEKLVRSLARA